MFYKHPSRWPEISGLNLVFSTCSFLHFYTFCYTFKIANKCDYIVTVEQNIIYI